MRLLIILAIFLSHLHSSAQDTIKVYFDLGVPSLSTTAMRQLDSLAYYDILIPNKNYGIIGYADYLGSEESNVTLSQNRANAVQQYLQGLGIKEQNIETVTGKGEVNRDINAYDGYPEDRRVDIVLGGFKAPTHSHEDAEYICRCGKPGCRKGPLVKVNKLKWSVFFEENKTDAAPKLRKGQDAVIKNLCDYLTAHPDKRVRVSGYFSGAGETVKVALERAQYVVASLKKCGIPAERVRVGRAAFGGDDTSTLPGNLWRADIIIDTSTYVQPEVKTNTTPKIDITNIKKDETIRLDNILFLPGSHRTRQDSEEALFHLYIVMKDHPTLKIRLEGHICCMKNTTHDGYDYDTQEYRLSENRAKAVYDYLVSKGIDEERLEYKGFGISKPLAWPERSFADENMNRRVEIRVLEK